MVIHVQASVQVTVMVDVRWTLVTVEHVRLVTMVISVGLRVHTAVRTDHAVNQMDTVTVDAEQIMLESVAGAAISSVL